ncbi:hypothetical protein PSMK_28560 [Phycisphaera mikurensis NBRC 102666]|uniref:Peptidase S8/S53 domain-containing protein n=1 Tax=Phycisphaera mikurensis (strain NBRC 102666 / KCTC 22515 / FYK2301M01) TaxID=1142394 RepID=I0IIC7_PHYMF|nr:hypothetical protein PSMK_28560 [Phycisphaera mikurensis NBRC 102666]
MQRRPAPAPRPLAETIGLAAASARLGEGMPDGSAAGGVILGLVEGGGAAYGPDPDSSDFANLEVELAGGPSGVSGHAAKTASILAGRRGVVASAAKLWAADVATWLGPAYLNLGTGDPPATGPAVPDVFSHSWVAFDAAGAVEILRRLDYAIDRDDALHAVGVNNGAATPMPPTLAGAYNAIAVGVDTGASSGGGTAVEVEGRAKPDLVAPGGLTSWATPAVAGVAALARDFLLARDGAAPPAEVVKAALMAGAAKPPGWSHDPAAGKPLDDHLGAGRVDADAALRVLQGGPLPPGAPIRSVAGYGFAELGAAAGAELAWTLDLPVDAGPLSVVAVWHRRIAARTIRGRVGGGGPVVERWATAPRLADLDLVLEREVGGGASEVQASRSRVDNVEHVLLPSTPRAAYRLRVTRRAAGEPWDVAVAWRLRPAGDAAVEPEPEPEAEPEPEPGAASEFKSEPAAAAAGSASTVRP